MKFQILILCLIFLLSCTKNKEKVAIQTSYENTIKKPSTIFNTIISENYNNKFDSIVSTKIIPLKLSETDLTEVLSKGKRYVYNYRNTQNKYSEFSTEKFFTPFYLDLFSEQELFNRLLKFSKAEWDSAVSYLQIFAVPNLKDKTRLIDMLSVNMDERRKLEKLSIIKSNLFFEDKIYLKKLMNRIIEMDSSQFLYGQKGKDNLLNNISYRYVYDNINTSSYEFVDSILNWDKSSDVRVMPEVFHSDPINHFLYSEPKYCETTISYLYEYSSEKIQKELHKKLSEANKLCIPSMNKYEKIDNIIERAQQSGLKEFNLSPSNKLFLKSQESGYGGGTPILKIISFSNIGIPFSEANSTLEPAIEITASIYKLKLIEVIKDINFITHKGEKFLTLEDYSNKTFGFNISKIENVDRAESKITQIFNYVLQSQSSGKRLVGLEKNIREGILIEKPSNVKMFVSNYDIELSIDRFINSN